MIKQFEKSKSEKLSRNFNSNEFDCKCNFEDCKTTSIDISLIDRLDELRDEIKKPIIITSGFRCSKHNQDIGGKTGSYHLIGKAADIRVPDMLAREVQEHCETFDGLGKADSFTHVDVRGYKARWRY